MRVIGQRHIGLLPARHVHRDQRIAIDVSLPDDLVFRIAGKQGYGYDYDGDDEHRSRNEEFAVGLFHACLP